MSTAKTNHKKQASLFAVVGVFNTLLDFTILNVLSLGFGFYVLVANVVSTSVAMVISFFLNKRFVFKRDTAAVHKQFILFIGITAFGLYVIQNILIEVFANRWLLPVEIAHDITQALSLPFTSDFVRINGAKAIATVASMVWNYVMYDKYVFKDPR